MGILRHLSSGRCVALSAHNVAGRAPGSAVHLTSPSASNDHASLSWTGSQWQARDLGSTNGTFVNEIRVEPREGAPITLDSILRFGHETERWELIDDHEPSVVARSLETGEVRVAEAGLLALPEPNDIEVQIGVEADGGWFIEASEGSRRPARDGEHLAIRGQTWELTVPSASPVAGTYKEGPPFSLATITVRLLVSRDEEHVRIDLLHDQRVVPLGERSSFELLLLLARERLADAAAAKLPEAEHGWVVVPDLMRALMLEEARLNIAVFRARHAFAKVGIEGANDIVERRSREIRIGTGHLEVIKA